MRKKFQEQAYIQPLQLLKKNNLVETMSLSLLSNSKSFRRSSDPACLPVADVLTKSVSTRRISDPETLYETKKKRTTPRRSVSFGSVKVRVCERVLGGDCACEQGPSLALGWNVHQEEHYELEEFESARACAPGSVRRLTSEERQKIAKKSGISRKDIEENIRMIRKQRSSASKSSSSLSKSKGIAASLFFGGKGRDSAACAIVLSPTHHRLLLNQATTKRGYL